MLKRLIATVLFIGAAALFAPKAEAQISIVFNGVSANSDSTTAPYPTGSYQGIFSCGKGCDFRVFSSAGSTATVTAYCRIDATASETWYPCSVCTNPSATGCYQTLATSRQYKFAIENYSAGVLTVKYFTSSQP